MLVHNNTDIAVAIVSLEVGQLFSVIHETDTFVDCWERVEEGYRCLVDDTGWDASGNPHSYPLGSSWSGGDLEIHVYDMDESARIMAILALTGKVPWEGKKR